jgi:uncharacterized protein (DUF433 family)
VDYRELIISTPETCFGKPRIAGTRIAVQDILDYLGGGTSEDELLREFPTLNREQILACMAFAADVLRRSVPTGN